VLKLVYAEQSGSRPLDEAAVAGISASNPFPPLPTEFKGERIVVQLNFAYNMPRR
jgi:outer membrane biosynthesis protein TonB